MIEGKLSNGFEYTIDDGALDDYELFEALADIDDEENPRYGNVKKAYKRILGEEQYNALKEHLRGENKRVSTQAMLIALEEILNNDEVKNSSPSDE